MDVVIIDSHNGVLTTCAHRLGAGSTCHGRLKPALRATVVIMMEHGCSGNSRQAKPCRAAARELLLWKGDGRRRETKPEQWRVGPSWGCGADGFEKASSR